MSSAFISDVLTARSDLRWQDDAACAPANLPDQVHPDDFFAGLGVTGQGHPTRSVQAAHARAVAVCRVCPVIDECRDSIADVAKVDRYGVWAGKVFKSKDKNLEEAS